MMVNALIHEGQATHHERVPPWSPVVDSHLDSLDPVRAAVLRQRLQAQFPVLRDRLHRLYGHLPGFEAQLTAILLSTLRFAQSRDDDLWALDLQREQHPTWLHEGLVGYCAYVDKFAGTLSGVAKRVPYLQELGVNYLHLLPFLKAGSPPNDGGFAVASFEEIEPALGSMDDLRVLCRSLREARISLCSDFVLNHVADEHQWAQAARAGDARYIDYFHWLPTAEAVQQQERVLNQVFPGTAPGNFTHIAERDAWVWSTFYPYQWDLNYANPLVFADIASAMLKLANQGVEALRLDSTGYLWKRPGTDCLNQPEVHHVLQALRALCALAAPALLLKAEAIMPTRELPPYFGLGAVAGAECQVAYHSSLMAASWLSLSEQDASAVKAVVDNTPDLPEGCAWLSYVRCHDDIGWNVLRPELQALNSDPGMRLAQASRHFSGQTLGSYAQGAAFQASDSRAVHGTNGMTTALTGVQAAEGIVLDVAMARMRLLYSLAFFVGGLPLIYMGDELGQSNVSPEELARRQGPDGRELHRPWFDETAADRRHDAQSLPGRCFAMVSGLSRWRRTHLANTGPLVLRALESTQPGVLLLQRGDAWGVFNFTAKACHLDLSHLSAEPVRCVSSDAPHVTGVSSLSLAPHAAVWLRPLV